MVQGIQKGPEPALCLQLQQAPEEQGGGLYWALVVLLGLNALHLICEQKQGQVSSLQKHQPQEDKADQPFPRGAGSHSKSQNQRTFGEAADSTRPVLRSPQ